jgi:hypothetical protein
MYRVGLFFIIKEGGFLSTQKGKVRRGRAAPVESVLPSTLRYVFPNDVIVSPSASSTK